MKPETPMAVGLFLLAALSACAQPPAGAEDPSASESERPEQSEVAVLSAPACDELEVIETVQDAFDTHQTFETKTGLELVVVADAREIGAVIHHTGEWRETRSCSARGELSNEETLDIWYLIRLPRVEDRIGYRVKPCFSSYDALHQGDCSAFQRTPEP